MERIEGGFKVGQVLLSTDLKVVGMNAYARKVLGPTVDDLGKSLFDYHPRKSHAKLEYILRRSGKVDTEIPIAMVIDVMGKVLMINFSHLDVSKDFSGPLFSMSFVDVSHQTGATMNPVKGIVELKKFPVWDKNAFIFLKPDAIFYIESDGNYCKIVTRSKSYFLQLTLKSILKRYTGSSFFRIHKSFIANLENVRRLKFVSHGRHVIEFDDPFIPDIPVARRRAAALKKALALSLNRSSS